MTKPGIRASGLLRAHPSLTLEEFRNRWLEDHVPRFSMRFANVEGIRCNVSAQERTGEQVFDGTQDMWWGSLEALQEDLASPHRVLASENVRTFSVPIDLITREHVLAPDAGEPGDPGPTVTTGLKVVALLKAKPGLDTAEEIEERWVRGHLLPLTMELKRLRGLRACIAPTDRVGVQPFDAIEDLWWDSQEDFEADVSSEEGVAAHKSSAQIMWATDLVVREYVFL